MKLAALLLTGALSTNPAGLLIRAERRFPLTENAYYGVFDSFISVSNEVGGTLGFITEPQWLAMSVEGGVEPGFFRREGGTTRTLGARYFSRAQATMNLEWGRWRLYSRSTLLYRHRGFVEADPATGLRLPSHERAWEQATALLRRVGDPWIYVEYTVGRIAGVATVPNRVSMGVITEEIGDEGLTMNLDLFYSFAPARLDGVGAIGAFWYAF